MEVSKVERAKTHVVMGGGQTTAFSMANTAEFFTVLSDTLYSNKILAVVREVICNAWDSHIFSGIENRPIEITVTDSEFIVKDFGAGIADSDMPDIYCRYGNSTKIKDNKQTGGFGLGCKAPFAYSDHFSVISCHKGTKTIYSISRGGAETKGVPDLRSMVSMEATESGLTVKVPIKESNRYEFARLANQIVTLGGINAVGSTNGSDHIQTPKINYKKSSVTGFMLFVKGFTELRPGHVFAKYGNVVYPVQSDEPKVQEMLDEIADNIPNGGAIILCCRPNSIGVTPSRESLSYTSETIKELQRLTRRYVDKMKVHLPAARNAAIKTIADHSDLEELEESISGYSWYSGYNNAQGDDDIKRTDDHKEAAKALVLSKGKVSSDKGFPRKFCAHMAKKAVDGRGPKIKKFWKSGMPNKTWPLAVENGFYPLRRAKGKAIRQLKQDWLWNTRMIRREGIRAGLMTSLFTIQTRDAVEMWGYKFGTRIFDEEVENEAIIAQSREEAKIYIKQKYGGNITGYEDISFICASIPRSKKSGRDKAKAMFEKMGYRVHTVEIAAPKKPKKVIMSDKFLSFSEVLGRDYLAVPHLNRTLENPTHFIACSPSKGELNYRDKAIPNRLAKCLKDHEYDTRKIAIVWNKTDVKKLIKAGSIPVMDELMDFIESKTNTSWMQYAWLLSKRIYGLSRRRSRVTSDSEYELYINPSWDSTGNAAMAICDYIPEAYFEFQPFFKSKKEDVVKWAEVINSIEPFYTHYSFRPNQDVFETETRWKDVTVGLTNSAYDKWETELLDTRGFEDRCKGVNMFAATYAVSKIQKSITLGAIKQLIKANQEKKP